MTKTCNGLDRAPGVWACSSQTACMPCTWMPVRIQGCSRSHGHTARGSWAGNRAAGAAVMGGSAQARESRATTVPVGRHTSQCVTVCSKHVSLYTWAIWGNPGVWCEQGAVALTLSVAQTLQCQLSCLKTLLRPGQLSKGVDNLRPEAAEPSPAPSPWACGDCWPPSTVGTHFSRNRAGRCGESSLSLVETAGDQGLKAERRWRG